MEHSIAGALRLDNGEAFLRFRLGSADADGDAPDAELLVHPPHPKDIIRMHEKGELYVHPSRLPLTVSVLAMMISNHQTMFNLPKGLRGGWNEQAWAKMKRLLSGVKRPRGQLSITAPTGPPEPPNTAPPSTPEDTFPGATVPSDSHDCHSSSDTSSSNSSEDSKADDKGKKEKGKDANDNKDIKENGKDASDMAKEVLYWKQKYENEVAERIRIEDELIATDTQYHDLDEENFRLRKEIRNLHEQLAAATMQGNCKRKGRYV